MRDLLPSHLIDFLRDRYIAGVATAEASFDDNSADEDALTGALGQALAMKSPITFTGSSGEYTVQVSYRKLRGRGINAPERLYGSDGLFQISVSNEFGETLRQKGLPFQAKTNWRGSSKAVASQSSDMEQTTGEGLVIDYSSTGYKACSTSIAIETHGNRTEANRLGAMKPLGQMLGVEFLECRIGEIGLYYDQDKERYTRREAIIQPAHAITTRIVKRTV